jgi:hypothetical protein
MDNCQHCQVRGDLTKCQDIPCNHHASWYAQELEQEIIKLKELLKRVYPAMHVCFKEAHETYHGHETYQGHTSMEICTDCEAGNELLNEVKETSEITQHELDHLNIK